MTTSDLFIQYDITSSQILKGPCSLSPDLIELTMEELNAEGWFLVLPVEYDIGESYDPNAFNMIGVNHVYTDTPYPAMRKIVLTEPRPLLEVKRYVTFRLTEFRNNLFDEGFTYGGIEFDGDLMSRLNWTAANAAITSLAYLNQLTPPQLDSLPGYQEWTRKDNNPAHFKRTEILHCGVSLAGWASDCFQYCRSKKTEVILAATFNEVWTIWTTNTKANWPNPDLGGTLALPQPSTNENLVSRPAEEQQMLKEGHSSTF